MKEARQKKKNDYIQEKKDKYDDISNDSDLSNEIKPQAGNDVPSRVV